MTLHQNELNKPHTTLTAGLEKSPWQRCPLGPIGDNSCNQAGRISCLINSRNGDYNLCNFFSNGNYDVNNQVHPGEGAI